MTALLAQHYQNNSNQRFRPNIKITFLFWNSFSNPLGTSDTMRLIRIVRLLGYWNNIGCCLRNSQHHCCTRYIVHLQSKIIWKFLSRKGIFFWERAMSKSYFCRSWKARCHFSMMRIARFRIWCADCFVDLIDILGIIEFHSERLLGFANCNEIRLDCL